MNLFTHGSLADGPLYISKPRLPNASHWRQISSFNYAEEARHSPFQPSVYYGASQSTRGVELFLLFDSFTGTIAATCSATARRPIASARGKSLTPYLDRHLENESPKCLVVLTATPLDTDDRRTQQSNSMSAQDATRS